MCNELRVGIIFVTLAKMAFWITRNPCSGAVAKLQNTTHAKTSLYPPRIIKCLFKLPRAKSRLYAWKVT